MRRLVAPRDDSRIELTKVPHLRKWIWNKADIEYPSTNTSDSGQFKHRYVLDTQEKNWIASEANTTTGHPKNPMELTISSMLSSNSSNIGSGDSIT